MQRWLTLPGYRRFIADDDDDVFLYRVLIHQLPREFHGLSHTEQAAALAERPELTGKQPWDAFLAAVVEHIARLHGHPAPAWVDEPERFLDRPWVAARTRLAARDSVLYAPAAFTRHATIPDPRDLDARGGERHEWLPPPDSRTLEAPALRRAFDGLSRQLAEHDIKAHIYVVGGAAMILSHRCLRATGDVDVLEVDRRDEVLQAAGEVAREQGLPRDWLNDAMRTAPWPDTRPVVVYDSPHLSVTGASAEQLLAMKVRAGRPGARDDIQILIRRLGISTLQHVEAIHNAVFPRDHIPETNMEVIMDCLDCARGE